MVRRYVYGEGIDEVLRATIPDNASDLDDDTITAENVDIYYHDNSIGSVVAVTNAAGTVLESYRYEAFGQATIFDQSGSVVSTTQVGQPFMFTGRRLDWEEGSGLLYYRLRYYDPAAGRFVSRDPLGLWGDPGQRGNGQSYCGNNPVNRVDPLGMNEEAIARAVAKHGTSFLVSAIRIYVTEGIGALTTAEVAALVEAEIIPAAASAGTAAGRVLPWVGAILAIPQILRADYYAGTAIWTELWARWDELGLEERRAALQAARAQVRDATESMLREDVATLSAELRVKDPIANRRRTIALAVLWDGEQEHFVYAVTKNGAPPDTRDLANFLGYEQAKVDLEGTPEDPDHAEEIILQFAEDRDWSILWIAPSWPDCGPDRHGCKDQVEAQGGIFLDPPKPDTPASGQE